MANKKSSAKKRSVARKKPTKKAAKKTSLKKAIKPKAVQSKKAAKKATTKRAKPAKKKVKRKTTKSLGRARVPGDSKLDLLFRKDYEAREIFEFLRVTTVKELEEHAPDEIIQRLTAPVIRSVDRIRKAMAINNRCLAGDQKFAIQFQDQFKKQFRKR